MRKILLSAIAFMMSAVFVLGCSATKQSTSESAEIQTSAISAVPSNSQKGTDYSIQDIVNLQDFLLAKPTKENLKGKPYDLDGDGAWTVFDLCLMKREVAIDSEQDSDIKENEIKMNVEVNGHLLTATLADNSSAKAFAELIKSEPLTIQMDDYANFEKVGKLPENLPRNDEQIRTEAGDIILYQGNQITIYYDENTWNFTRIGKIDNITQAELKEILGTDSVSVTFSLERKAGVFDMESKTVLLNSGYEMPILGLGTYSLLDDTCVNSVVAKLQSGGRLIDTAYMYHNEEAVGEGIKQSGVPREEIFVETKLYPNQYADAENAINEALEKLDVEYIDLMLLHHPGTNDVKAYKAMEQAVKDGKIRSIGLSNWYIEELEEFLPQIEIMPALVQNEIHPYYQEIEVVPYIQSLGIVVQGWYPLGGRGYTSELLGDETINAIAKAHNVSAAQVILRWNLQRSVIVIPGSSNPDHIKENLDLFDFELSGEEMEQIKSLNRDEKHDWY